MIHLRRNRKTIYRMSAAVCKSAINRFIFCKQGLKEDREELVEVASNLFSLCSSNKIQASVPMDEIINSWGQTAPSSVSLFMASGERERGRKRDLLPELSMANCMN